MYEELINIVTSYLLSAAEPVSRTELNRQFRTVATDRLSTAILNLLEYGWIHKKLDEQASTVVYWPSSKLFAYVDKPDHDYGLVPDPLGNRKSGYPDFVAGATSVSSSQSETSNTDVDSESVTNATNSVPDPKGEITNHLVLKDPDCPVQQFLASDPPHLVRAHCRARAIFIFIAMRQHWIATGVINLLNEEIRPFLVAKAIKSLISDRVIKEVVVSDPTGDVVKLEVCDEGFLARVDQIEPPARYDLRLVNQSSKTPVVSESAMKLARLIDLLSEDDQTMITNLIIRLTPTSGQS